MEKVSIQDASRILNVSQAVIRRYAREGQLKAYKEGGPTGTKWMIELPDEGWLDDAKESYMKLGEDVPRWWWSNKERTGKVHYIEDVGIEELQPKWLCGLETPDMGSAQNHTVEERCEDCARLVAEQGL